MFSKVSLLYDQVFLLDQAKHKNFQNLDYHPLEYYNFQTLGFALVSLTGEQLHARDQLERRIYNETHISLIFKHFPSN